VNDNIMKQIYFSKCIIPAMCALSAADAAIAQTTANYPARPIRVFIGFAPGGPADIAGRVIGPKLSEALGQAVVIENRGGAGGTIGMELVAKAAPDGYTLGLGSSGNLVVAPHLYPKAGYNVQRDLATVSQIAITAYAIAVNPSVPVKNVRELVKLAISKKDLLSYGSSGSGASSHVAAELFSVATGAQMVHVPYKGTGPALTAVVAGEIDLMFADLIPALPHANNGRLRLLATLSGKRSLAAPNLPTVAEAGVKMQSMEGRYGIVAPTGTPREIITRLHTAIVSALKAPEIQQRFVQIGFEVVGDTPEQFAATLKSEGDAIGAVIRKAGIKPDA
jgi:tripartite-type tricarboxylate transporter receptor subunit TctC